MHAVLVVAFQYGPCLPPLPPAPASEGCHLQITVLSNTTSGQHKVKLMGVAMCYSA